VGATWQAPVQNVEVHVAARTALDGAACVTGPEGSSDPCVVLPAEPGHLVTLIDALDTGEASPSPPTPVPRSGARRRCPRLPPRRLGAGRQPAVPGVLAGGIALLAAALASLLILRAGQERVPTVGVPVTVAAGEQARIDLAELAGYVVASPSLPAGLSPAQGGAARRPGP
jgi:hypothetical protein